MAKRHYYQRRYYYKNFKSSMDRAYAWVGGAALILGLLGWAELDSGSAGFGLFAASLVWSSICLSMSEPRLARFWGENEGGAGCAVVLIKLLHWAVWLGALVWLISKHKPPT